MHSPRRLTGFSLVHLLLLVAVAELSINRLAVPALRPPPSAGSPPVWHAVLDHVGLFLLYFASTLAIGILFLSAAGLVRSAPEGAPARAAAWLRAGILGGLAAVAAVAVVAPPSATTSFLLQTFFAAAVVALIATVVVRRPGWGVAAGVLLVGIPLLIYYGGAFASHFVLSEDQVLDTGLTERIQRWGTGALCLAAVLSPYCFAPRPLARALTRPLPLVVALAVAGLGAVLVRQQFAVAVLIARTGMGLELGAGAPDNQLAMYLLGLSTMAWTLAACATADTEPRRQIGLGLGLLVLAGYGFEWPLQYLLGVVGLATVAHAAPHLRDAEAGAPVPHTPPIDDTAWQAYVTALVAALRRGAESVNAVTVRGDGELISSIVVGDRAGLPFKLRIERYGGSVLWLDLVFGRELDERRAASFTLWARPDRMITRGNHPEPPPTAAGPIKIDDDSFEQRFRSRGDQAALLALLDDGLRARLTASADGWLAVWSGESVRYRVYPGAGAPLDHPVPISDLAMRRAGASAADRLVGVVELVGDIAARALPRTDDAAPAADASAGEPAGDGGAPAT